MKTDNITKLYNFLKDNSSVKTIILFGSVARADHTYASDVDLLLVVNKESEGPRIKKLIKQKCLTDNSFLSVSIYSAKQIALSYCEGSLFVAHLLKDGVILYDDGFYQRLLENKFRLSKNRLRLNLKLIRQRLDVVNDLNKYNHMFIAVLSDFFSISRNLAYTLLAIDDCLEFNKKRAFKLLALQYPKYSKEILELQELEPFFLRNTRGISEPTPFRPVNCDNKVLQLREHINDLINLGVDKIGY